MSHENEDKVMKAVDICSGGSSCWHMFAPSVRAKRSDSHVRPPFWLQILLVILLAGKASCQTSAAPTSPLPPTTTTAQTSVLYIINVTVDVTGQAKVESEIKARLVNVFQNMLESCVSPDYGTTTTTPNYTQISTATTSVTLSNNTTTATTSVTLSNNTTTATTSVTFGNNTTTANSTLENNNTTTATTSTTLSNNTTTATTSVTLGNNTTTANSTLENNNTTTATTSTMLSNNTTTATTLSNNTTTATTPVTLSNNMTTAATLSNNTTTATTLSNNTTTATTSVMLSNNTTTATTLSNNTTTATTALESVNTTAITSIILGNNTTTATTTSTLESSNTTTATTPTTKSSNKTTATTSTTLESSITDTATTSTMLESNITDTATTSTMLESNITDTATTSTLESSKTDTATTSTMLESSKTDTATTSSTSSTKDQSTTAATTQDNNSPTFSPSTIMITQTPNSGGTSLSNGNASPRQSRSLRIVRDVGSSVPQSSGISTYTTTGLFQNIDISCATNTSVTHTECSVKLELKQTVPACCILRTLCAASNTSSDINVMGNKVYRDQPQNACNSNPQEENSCTYTAQASKSCAESEAAYVSGQTNSTNCGSVIEDNACNCSSYCSNSDAYYTFQISIQNLESDSLYVSSLISQKLKQLQNCTPSSTVSCPLSVVAFEYKDASVTCGNKVTNRRNCSVILHFANEVPICSVAAAMMDTFQSQDKISFDGLVTRAAICGNSDVSNSSLTSQFTWVNLKPASFCMVIKESDILTCQSEGKMVVQLEEQCVEMLSTTPSPNVTTIQPNTTTSSMNVTSSPLNTTANPLNATTTAANVTVTTTLNTTTTTSTNGSGSVTPTKNTATNETAESQANALLDLTRDVSKLNSSQVDQLVSQLESLLSGPNVSLALGKTSINIVSNLLNASPEKLAQSSNRIIGIVDTVGLKLVLGNTAETLLSPSVALSVKPADGSNFQETFFSISDPSNVQVRGNPRLRRSVTTNSSIPQGSITLPPSLTQALTPEEQRLATRVQFNFYQKSTVFQDKSLGQRKLNSGILGASVANLTITGLKDNVVIYLRNTEPIPANFVTTCVFWDFTLNNRSGGWNPKGCVVQNSTDYMTVCGCNHLTSFAVLLDLSRQSIISPLQNTILTFITYIGCGISAIFLSVTLLTYLAFEKLRKDIPSKILIQLCFALLLLNLVFLVDAWLALYTDAVGLCISTAWFLHYFLLVSFTWMGLEAVHMYNALVKVFNNNISRYMLKFSLVGWGIPMIVVIIVIAIDKNNYGLVSYGKFTDGRSDEFCWLKNNIAFYVAVVAYFCVIFVFNFIMFIVVLVQLSRIKRQNPHNVQHRSTLEDVRSVAGITVLLGLTWGFAFFAWGPLNLAFMYLFAIFNSLQGLFIFVFFCAVKDNVRRQWRTYLCCGRLRLAENSEWSRTATQKTVKKSSLTKLKSSKSSQSNSSSSSTSFLVTDSSEQSSGISSPFEDRVIRADEDSSMDVILNEINRQYRNQQAL